VPNSHTTMLILSILFLLQTVASVPLMHEETLSGLMLYKEKIALTPGHIPVVKLQDVTNFGHELARVTLPKTKYEQPPFTWSLTYNSSSIKESHTYSLKGEIYMTNRTGQYLQWETAAEYWVITKGHQTAGGHSLILSLIDPASNAQGSNVQGSKLIVQS
jgi:uncharacterized lipoprotein YbaY